MPRLILFAACEKVILDTEGIASLIMVIEKLEVLVPKGIDIKPRTGVPLRWQSIAIWALDPVESGLYEQQVVLIVKEEHEEIIAQHTDPMVLQKAPPGTSAGVKLISTMTSAPVVDGPIFLRVSYRKVGDQEWTQAAEYPMAVSIVRI